MEYLTFVLQTEVGIIKEREKREKGKIEGKDGNKFNDFSAHFESEM